MPLKIPYFKQKTDYTCGPATLKMALSFFGISKSEKKLRKLASTKHDGTKHWGMINAARKQGFYVYVNEQSTLAELKYYLSIGYPVIINFIAPTEEIGHYGLVTGFGRLTGSIIFHDPWYGANYRMSEKAFLARWYDYHRGKRYDRWMMVISKTPLPLGRQYGSLLKKLNSESEILGEK